MSGDPGARARALRPDPIVTEDNQGFWEAAQQGRLVAYRCSACGELHHPPRPMCPACHSVDLAPFDLAGTGSVYSFAILHHPQHPAFDYPVVAVLVDLDEGVRLLSNLMAEDPAVVRIGMRVQVCFVATAGGMEVPVFVPREELG